jgi:hypothetical protein
VDIVDMIVEWIKKLMIVDMIDDMIMRMSMIADEEVDDNS